MTDEQASTKNEIETTQKTTPKNQPKPSKNNTTLYIVLAVVAVVFVIPLILFLTGAAFVGHKLATSGVKVDSKNGTVSVKSKNGDEITAGESKTLPKDFPSQVTVYKGTIMSSGKVTLEGKTTWTASISTNDDLSKVASSLSQTFSTNGWTATMDNQSTEGGLIVAKNGSLQANVYYTAKDGKTTIVYTVGTTSTQ